MRRHAPMIRPLLPAAAMLAASCSSASPAPSVVAPVRSAVMHDSAGQRVGTASLLESPPGALLVLKLQAIPPGTHGVHLHANGACDPPSFESAGPHLNPAGRKHGPRNPDGPHAGDLPNLRARTDGSVDTTFVLPRDLLTPATLGPAAPARALVVHANADDLVTDPSGSSGPRIACGVLDR
jgi:Cu-Zn family superoxide dismutase